MKITDEMKPCPFCGGEAKRHDVEERNDVDNAGASYIECEKCGACTQLHFDRKENLVDSWNRRAPADAGVVESLHERLFEAEEIIKERDERLSLVDRIADLIGLPQDRELDQVSFELWFEENRALRTKGGE